MFGAYGRALVEGSLLFVSGAALDADLGRKLGLTRPLAAVSNTRSGIGKASMIHNGATPVIEVNPETYEVRADGELLICEPAEILPMAQRYFLF
jgi:urease subunit alpha